MKANFSLEAGLLIRGAIRQELARARFQLANAGCTVKFEEHKSWTGSLFLVRADGPPRAVQLLVNWSRRIADEDSP